MAMFLFFVLFDGCLLDVLLSVSLVLASISLKEEYTKAEIDLHKSKMNESIRKYIELSYYY
jgi:hypothetical protein